MGRERKEWLFEKGPDERLHVRVDAQHRVRVHLTRKDLCRLPQEPTTEAAAALLGSPPDSAPAPVSPARIRWAVLLARIYDVLPLVCPACRGDRNSSSTSPFRRMDESFKDQPLVAAGLQNTVGDMDFRLEAERLIVASLEINRDLLGEGDPESIEVLADYALVLTEQARFKEAIEVHQRVLELRRRVFHLEVADRPRAISSSSSSTRAPPSTPPSPTPSGNSSSTSPCPTTSAPESPDSSQPALSPPTAIPAHPRIPAAYSAFLTPPRSPASPHVRLGRARTCSIPVLAPTPRPAPSHLGTSNGLARLLPSKPVRSSYPSPPFSYRRLDYCRSPGRREEYNSSRQTGAPVSARVPPGTGGGHCRSEHRRGNEPCPEADAPP